MSPPDLTRRDFIIDASAAAVGAMIVPRHVLGGPRHRAPSDTLGIAIIGAGGMGTENAQELGSENIVAVCDIDMGLVERKVLERTKDEDGKPRPAGLHWKEQFEKAAKYSDFRVMLEKQTDIDAVVIATPDHLHAGIAKAAMELGKHVYVQKPLTWSVYEARVLRHVAGRTGVVTQMGNQGHSSDEARRINEIVQAGVLGEIRDVYVWTNRPIWPQGVPRPGDVSPKDPTEPPSWDRGAITDRTAKALAGNYRPPEGVDWELYLGPVKDDVAYHPIYHPFNWRGWVDFGVGALGDMGAHLVDHPFWALDLGYPASVEASSTPWGGPRDAPVTFPLAMTATYEFPARGDRPEVRMHWYDGGLLPARHELLPADVELDPTGGVLYAGEKGILLHETYGRNPKVYPESAAEAVEQVPESLPRIEDEHEMNWAKACKGEAEATSPFEYAAPLTEVMLLGIVALRVGQGRTIQYDAENMTITNVPEADHYLTREYRPGWEV